MARNQVAVIFLPRWLRVDQLLLLLLLVLGRVHLEFARGHRWIGDWRQQRPAHAGWWLERRQLGPLAPYKVLIGDLILRRVLSLGITLTASELLIALRAEQLLLARLLRLRINGVLIRLGWLSEVRRSLVRP